MTIGMDFKGKTSSAVAKPPTLGSVVVIFSKTSEVFSLVVDFMSDSSEDAIDSEVSTSTWPKYPLGISSKEEVSVPVRAILILPRPSCLN